MAIRPVTNLADFEIQAFSADYAPLVAGWVKTPRDLFLLAPSTPPPLTAEKVLAWTTERDNPQLLRRVGAAEPVGYAELNAMPHDQRDLWIGHLIVPEHFRGQGAGYAFVMHLMERAFSQCDARKVSLVVFPENEVAVHCYLKAGMVKNGIQIKAFDHVSGKHKMLKMTMTSHRYRNQKILLGT